MFVLGFDQVGGFKFLLVESGLLFGLLYLSINVFPLPLLVVLVKFVLLRQSSLLVESILVLDNPGDVPALLGLVDLALARPAQVLDEGGEGDPAGGATNINCNELSSPPTQQRSSVTVTYFMWTCSLSAIYCW